MLYKRMAERRAKARKEAQKAKAPADSPEEFVPADFDDFTEKGLKALKVGAELKPLAEHLGIEGFDKMKGADLVSAILEVKPEDPEDPKADPPEEPEAE